MSPAVVAPHHIFQLSASELRHLARLVGAPLEIENFRTLKDTRRALACFLFNGTPEFLIRP
jgi:hypothetical protein